MKTFFSEKHCFFIIVSNVSNVQSFLIFFAQKKPYNQGEDIFDEQNHLIGILQQIFNL